jgi:hypothetical protein
VQKNKNGSNTLLTGSAAFQNRQGLQNNAGNTKVSRITQGINAKDNITKDNTKVERFQANNNDFDANNDVNFQGKNNDHFKPTGSMLFSAQPKRNQELMQKMLYFPESISSIKPEEQSKISMSNMNLLRSSNNNMLQFNTEQSNKQSNAKSAKQAKGLSFFARANSLRHEFLNQDKKSVEKASQEKSPYAQAFRYNERVVHSPDSESSQTLSDLEVVGNTVAVGKGGTNVRGDHAKCGD